MEIVKTLTKLGLKAMVGIIVLNSVMISGAALFKAGQMDAVNFGKEEKEAEVKIE